MQDDDLLIEAIRYSILPTIEAQSILPFALCMPVLCTGWCEETYVLFVNKPVALQIERGELAQNHTKLLEGALAAFCDPQSIPSHVRTDGKSVWFITDEERTRSPQIPGGASHG